MKQHPAYACGIEEECKRAEDHGTCLNRCVGFAVTNDSDADGGERDGGSCTEETGEAFRPKHFGQHGEEADDDAADQETGEEFSNLDMHGQ